MAKGNPGGESLTTQKRPGWRRAGGWLIVPVAAVLAFGAWQISAGGPVSPRPASSSLSPPPARTLTQKGGSPSLDRMSLEVQEGDTFGKLLDRAGVAPPSARR